MPGLAPFYGTQTSRLKELREDAEILQTKIPFSTNESAYVALVIRFIECGIDFLARQEEKITAIASTDLTISVREQLVDRGKQLVRTANQALRIIHKSESFNLPMGTDGLIRDIFSSLSDKKVDFFLNVSAAQDYSVIPLLYENLKTIITRDLEGTVPPELNKTIVVINIFDTQKKDVLRHGVFAHEAGHALLRIDPTFITAFDRFLRVLLADLEAAIAQFIASLKSAVTDDQKAGFQATQFRFYRSWLEELFVDLVSVHTLGPAAYFAMNEMTQEEWSLSAGPGEQHPPIYKRCFMMLEYLLKTEFTTSLPDVLQSELTDQSQRYGKFPELDPLLEDHQFDLLNSIFSTTNVQKLVECFISSGLRGRYTPAVFKSEIPKLKEYYEHGIAVCELVDLENKSFTQVSCQSLLNTCWLIEHEKNLGTDKLNSILNKALTNLYLKQRWVTLGVQ